MPSPDAFEFHPETPTPLQDLETPKAPRTLTPGEHRGYIAECQIDGLSPQTIEVVKHFIRVTCTKYKLYWDEIKNSQLRIYSKHEKPGTLLLALKEIQTKLSVVTVNFGAEVVSKSFTYPIAEDSKAVSTTTITADEETRRVNSERDPAAGSFDEAGALQEVQFEGLAEALMPKVFLEMPELIQLQSFLTKTSRHKGINVIGPAGAGKSTATLQAINNLREEGKTVIVISCSGVDTEDGQELRTIANDILNAERASEELKNTAEAFLDGKVEFKALTEAWNTFYKTASADENTIIIKLTDDLTRVGTIAHENIAHLEAHLDIATLRSGTEMESSARAQARQDSFVDIGISGVKLARSFHGILRPTENFATFVADQLGETTYHVDITVLRKLLDLFAEKAGGDLKAPVNPLALQRVIRTAKSKGAIITQDKTVAINEETWAKEIEAIKAAANLTEISDAQMAELASELGEDSLLIVTWLVGLHVNEIAPLAIRDSELKNILITLHQRGVIEYSATSPLNFTHHWLPAAANYSKNKLSTKGVRRTPVLNTELENRHPLLKFHVARQLADSNKLRQSAAAAAEDLYQKGEFARVLEVAATENLVKDDKLSLYESAAQLALATSFEQQIAALRNLSTINSNELKSARDEIMDLALSSMLFVYGAKEELTSLGNSIQGRIYGLEVRLRTILAKDPEDPTKITELQNIVTELSDKESFGELTILVRAATMLGNKVTDPAKQKTAFETALGAANKALTIIAGKANIPARGTLIGHLVAKKAVAGIRSVPKPEGINAERGRQDMFIQAETAVRKINATNGIDPETAMGLKAQIWIHGLNGAFEAFQLTKTAEEALACLKGIHEMVKDNQLEATNLRHQFYIFNYVEALHLALSAKVDVATLNEFLRNPLETKPAETNEVEVTQEGTNTSTREAQTVNIEIFKSLMSELLTTLKDNHRAQTDGFKSAVDQMIKNVTALS